MRLLRDIQNDYRKVGRFGINYLDDKLYGILLGDLILIGARSGAGKTTLAAQIARINGKSNKKTVLFSLENSADDHICSIAYQYFINKTGMYSLSERQFVTGENLVSSIVTKEESDKYLEEAYEVATSAYSNITLYTRESQWTAPQLKDTILREAKNGAELIVLDHLDYVDKEYDDISDNEHISSLMRAIREAQNTERVAVVAISHLRKPFGKTSKDDIVVPSVDEFIGSSNKVKEATVVVTLAPADSQNEQAVGSEEEHIKGTWCCIRKLRMGGIDNRAALLRYNKRTRQYEANYKEYKVTYSGSVKEIMQ